MLQQTEIGSFIEATGLFKPSMINNASRYLFEQLQQTEHPPTTAVSHQMVESFEKHLRSHHLTDKFKEAREPVRSDLTAHFQLLREWLHGYLIQEAPERWSIAEVVEHLEIQDEMYFREIYLISKTPTPQGAGYPSHFIRLSLFKMEHRTEMRKRLTSSRLANCRWISDSWR